MPKNVESFLRWLAEVDLLAYARAQGPRGRRLDWAKNLLSRNPFLYLLSLKVIRQ